MIRIKLVLKYEDERRPNLIYESCLRDTVTEPNSRVRAKVVSNRLLLLLKGSKPSKVAEKLRNILGLINMVDQAISLLEN
ncbi:MAG: hypothetical protein QXR97_00630 [Thermoproteota archaeon]